VIQKHAARRLHYDLRLELDGVMLSWAIPKGPSFDTRTRRLAVRTEDHPLDYLGFEGVIPRGEYGGGAMIVWDRGRWAVTGEGDAHTQLAAGHLRFTLEGEKVHGRWHLLRTKGFDDADGNGKGESWLFFKGKDEHADATRDIVAERPESIVSGRTVEQVAGGD
jgi:bifunctional non-homologous end joining protein LigD